MTMSDSDRWFAAFALAVLVAPAHALAQASTTLDYHGFGVVNPGDCEVRLKLEDGHEWAGQLFLDEMLTVPVRSNKQGDRLFLPYPVMPQQTLRLTVRRKTDGKPVPVVPLTINQAVDVWPAFPPCRTTDDDRPDVGVTLDYGYLNNTFAAVPNPSLEDPGDPLRIPSSATIQPFAGPELAWRIPKLRFMFIEAGVQLGAAAAVAKCVTDSGDPVDCDLEAPNASVTKVNTIFANARTAEWSGGLRIEGPAFGSADYRSAVYLRGVLNRAVFAGTDLKARDHHRPVAVGLRVISGRLRDTYLEVGHWATNELIVPNDQNRYDRWWFASQVLYTPSAGWIPAALRRAWPQTRILLRAELDTETGRDWFRFTFGFNTGLGSLGVPGR